MNIFLQAYLRKNEKGPKICVDFWICSFSFGVADAISDSDFGLLAATFLY